MEANADLSVITAHQVHFCPWKNTVCIHTLTSTFRLSGGLTKTKKPPSFPDPYHLGYSLNAL